jgi:tetratricopeptide (TPR) repeat protein
MRLGFLATIAFLLATGTAPAAGDSGASKEAAVRLYDRGVYVEAQAMLVELDKAGALDGPLLYRLFFCEKAAGQDDESKAVLERARVALEAETAASASLEGSFYLANTYSNLGRSGDAHKVAREMTDRIESKKTAVPTTGIGLFQVAKLYQDQGRQDEASSFYAKAAETLDLSEGRYMGNLRWALRYIGNTGLQRAEFASCERAMARLTGLPGAEAGDWDTLAVARVRLGKYTEASAAWNAAVRLDPANGDDPRYAARLADAGAALAPLPTTPSKGAAFKTMGQADLEAFLKTCMDAAKADQQRAVDLMKPEAEGKPPRALDPKVRAELAASLQTTRRELVAAGLEYAVRHYGIRETAFRDGYALLIFHDRAWDLPPDPGTGS